MDPEEYPLYFEAFLQRLHMPRWTAATLLAAIMGSVFLLSDYAAGIPSVRHLIVVVALLISISLAFILTAVVRDRSVAAYKDLIGVLETHQHSKLLAVMKTAFDQRRGIVFAMIVGIGGVIHHVTLSYLQWSRIWWYTAVDIVLVGFVWWFIVAMLLWLCVNVAWSSFIITKRLKFKPNIISDTNMCGLESYATLSVVPAIAWAAVVTFGTLSTFDPFVSKELPQLILLYLVLDFIIIAGSLTVVFALPVLGFRAIMLPFKKSLHNVLVEQAKHFEIRSLTSHSPDDKMMISAVYLLELSERINRIKEWPFSFGSGVRFILSYVTPISIYIGRVILLVIFKVQVPV